MKKYDAVISGYICVDLIPDFKKNKSATSIFEVLKPGKLIEIDGLHATLGGVVANTGIAMKKFSQNVFLNGAIGDDFIGKIAKRWLDDYALKGDIKIMKKEGTAFGLVIAPPGVDRIFLESLGCSQLFDNSCIDFDTIAQSRLFHFGYPPLLKQFYLNEGTQLIDMFSEVQRAGVVTSMDFSLPDNESESGKINWPKILKRVLPHTDIFVPSLEEALQIMMPSAYTEIQATAGGNEIIDFIPIETIREIGQRIIDAGVKIALIKAGHRGAFLWTNDITAISENSGFDLHRGHWNFRELWCDAYPVEYSKIKSASGAGDTAAAAFLSAILNGESPESSLQYATIAGRNNLYCYNIHDELPGWPEMTSGIKVEVNPVVNLKQLKNNNLPGVRRNPVFKKQI
ncbi:MAG: carbohydrate kinase family protein [Chitinophagaceae bacterium]|nr:MAG: carbohydrate kinase family protein [Chitinophagaceae bacterium]